MIKPSRVIYSYGQVVANIFLSRSKNEKLRSQLGELFHSNHAKTRLPRKRWRIIIKHIN